MSAVRFLSVALLSAASAVPAIAQDAAPSYNEFALRSSGSIAFIQSRPTGAFQENVGLGYGVNAAYLFRLDRAGVLSLRADGAVAVYGSEHFYAPLSSTVGGRIQVKVTTQNYVVPLSIGPQLQWPRGPVRPYVNAGIGAQLFATQSGVEGRDGQVEFAKTTNQSDWTSNWVAGGGVYVPLLRGKSTVMLDMGVQYYNGGRAQYLKPGSIEDLGNGQIRITPLESDTHMMLMRLGVRIGL